MAARERSAECAREELAAAEDAFVVVGGGNGDSTGGRVALGLGGLSLRAAEELVVVNGRSVLQTQKREDGARARVAKVRHGSKLILDELN